MNKERRTDIRIPLLAESMAWGYDGNDIKNVKTCKMTDISKNGVFIECNEYPETGEVIQVYFQLPNEIGIISLKAKVEWRRWAVTKKSKLATGFGVSIIHTDPKIEKIMESYAIYLRNKQIIVVSKRIIEEYLGMRPNPNDKGPVA